MDFSIKIKNVLMYIKNINYVFLQLKYLIGLDGRAYLRTSVLLKNNSTLWNSAGVKFCDLPGKVVAINL